jgi:hypothetical protein
VLPRRLLAQKLPRWYALRRSADDPAIVGPSLGRVTGRSFCVLPASDNTSPLLTLRGHSVQRRQLIATWSMGVPVLAAMYSRAIGSTSLG